MRLVARRIFVHDDQAAAVSPLQTIHLSLDDRAASPAVLYELRPPVVEGHAVEGVRHYQGASPNPGQPITI